MDSVVHSALEEICSQGSGGITLQNLWPKLHQSLSTHGLPLCPYVKSALWSNILNIPGLQFEAQGVSYNPQQDSPFLKLVEKCEQMNLKIIASEQLRNCFVGIYDIEASSSTITQPQRRTLERLAIAKTDGITQSQLAKEFGIKGNNIFYILKKLECRGLIVRQSTVVKTKEACSEGEPKNSSVVTTNMLHLYRYAKHLGSQQRLEIIKEDKSFADSDIGDGAEESGFGFNEESVKEDVHVKDYLPPLKVICDKLEQVEGKVLVVSDIKQDLGYRGTSGHRAWRNICHRLKDAHVVEEFCAKVNKREVTCLRLLKKFSPKHFEPKSSGKGYDDMDGEQPAKSERRGQISDQLVELPVEHQIYDIIDAEGSKGITITEVCKRLRLRNKQYYDRLLNMFSRFGMHLQAESYNRGVAYRVWTSRNFSPGGSNTLPSKPESIDGNTKYDDQNIVHLEVEGNPCQTIQEGDSSTFKDDIGLIDGIAVEPEVSYGSTEDGEGNSLLLSVNNSENSVSELSGRVPYIELDPVCATVSDTAIIEVPPHATSTMSASELALIEVSPPATSTVRATELSAAPMDVSVPATSKRSRRRSYQRYPCLTLGAASAQREQRILKMLEEDKFLLKPELHRRLENLEKEKNTMMDRKTLERSLNKLQQEGQCKCIHVSVPVTTNLGRSRTTYVVLHPSVYNVPPEELLGQIHERMRSFEMEVRRHSYSRLNKGQSVPVLDSVPRIPSSVKLDTQAEQAEARRANGYVLAKMVRTKLLHIFLWGYMSSVSGWDEVISFETDGYDMKNPHSTCRLFDLEGVIKAMPLELFLQVLGSNQKFENLIEKCRSGFCLSDLPLEEYKCLMDTRAMGRLSWLIDILRRLKLIRLVSTGQADGVDKVQHTVLTHALELKPYIEEPISIVSSSSGFFFPDLRPHMRHDFVLSTRKAVDEYWNTLEYCYAAANTEAALHAFPGSAVHEVFLSRSWVSVRVMSADQRAELLKRVVHNGPHKKLSFRECEKIAEDLNLTLEQVLRVYYDRRQRRLTRLPGNSHAKDEEILQMKHTQVSSSRKRNRKSKHLTADTEDEQLSKERLVQRFLPEDHESDWCRDDIDYQMEAAEEQESNEKDGNDSIIHKCALSTLKPGRRKMFSWTEAADRQLVIEYVRNRAALGAKVHRTDWASLANLPAPPDTCRRRMALLNSSLHFRKAVMRLCNMLALRYDKYLEKFQKNLSDWTAKKVMVREYVVQGDNSQKFSDSFEPNKEFESEERWDNFDDSNIKTALNNVLQYKRIAKSDSSKEVDSDRWFGGPGPHCIEMDPSAPPSQDGEIFGGRSKLATQRSRSRRFPQKYSKLLNEGTIVRKRVYESVAVSNAVELFKLIFLSTSTSPHASTVLAETLRRYSQHDLFAAFSYLREKKMMTGGNGTSPFVLSDLYLESIYMSPFPTNTGKRASKFSNWLDERKKDLMEEEIDLPADLQCGDLYHLCALLSGGELSILPHLPEEGVGEADDSKTSKRKLDITEFSTDDKSKRMRTKTAGEGEIFSRREKGFPGIRLSLSRATIPRIHALELLEDENGYTASLCCEKDQDNATDLQVAITSSHFDECYPVKEIIDSRVIVETAVVANKSPWEAMADYAEYLLSSLSDEKRNSPFHPELFKSICSAIQKSGDQGLSMKEIPSVLNVPGDKEQEIVVQVLETFGRALKVHAYDSIHLVDSLYQTKYFLTTIQGTDQISKVTRIADSEGKMLDEHLFYIQNEIDAASVNEVHMDSHELHRVTILNHPKEVTEPSVESQTAREVEDHAHSKLISVRSNPRGEMFELPCGDSHISRHIIPWVNGDGTINQLVYKGLVRRVLGIVMQHPGIMEDEVIKQMCALNPQSCRKLLEMMILDNHITVRKMHENVSAEPPTLLGSLFGSCSKKSESVCREYFFANPLSCILL